jgi:hypothetical protein
MPGRATALAQAAAGAPGSGKSIATAVGLR